MTARSRRTPDGLRLTPSRSRLPACDGARRLHAWRPAWRPGSAPRARDIGLAPGVFPPAPLNAITDVAGVRVGHDDAHRGRHGPHRRHRDRAARRQPVPGQGGRRGLRRQRVRQAGRLDAGRRTRHDRNADRPHQHAGGRHRRRRRRPLHARAARQRARAVGERAGRRDQRRRAERHPRPARDDATTCWRPSGAPRRGPGRRRDRSAPAPARSASAGRAASAPSSRVLPARYGGYTLGVLVQTNFGGVLTMDGAPVGQGAGTLRVRAAADRAGRRRRRARRLVHDRRGHRRAGRRARPAAARRARGLRPRPAPARPTATAAATSRSRSRRRRTMRTRFGESQPRQRARCCRPTACRRCSRRRSRRPRRRSTTRCLRATTVTSRQRTVEAIPIDRVVADPEEVQRRTLTVRRSAAAATSGRLGPCGALSPPACPRRARSMGSVCGPFSVQIA